jgi:hypothetical protein
MFGRESLMATAERKALRRLNEAARAFGVFFEVHRSVLHLRPDIGSGNRATRAPTAHQSTRELDIGIMTFGRKGGVKLLNGLSVLELFRCTLVRFRLRSHLLEVRWG